jgi:hypothetical protein
MNTEKRDDGGMFYETEVNVFQKTDIMTDSFIKQETFRLSGINRRDWLAGLAMQGIMSTEGSLKALPKGDPARNIANMSYQFADAMIQEGKK